MTVQTNDEILYQAMLSRDRRFDGRFFVGVRTTGIYCRPICPAPKPMFKNVQFYTTAAGAETGGFRPCKRCRPDSAPGTPIWHGASAHVSRALQLIDNGFLDDHNVTGLGDVLGITDRQLRRLFTIHLGASPHVIALTRRLDFARKLIDQTALPMTEVAFASGFESIRRFNDAVRKRFGQNPSVLREALKKKPDTKHAESGLRNTLRLFLPYRPPLDFAGLLTYLQGRLIKGVEVIDGRCYRRSIRSSGNHFGFISVSESDGNLELLIQLDETSGLMEMVNKVRRIFDLGADPMFIAAHLRQDGAFAEIVEQFPGLRVPGGWDNFELAVRTIIGQQVSIPGANTIMQRLVQRTGERLPENACSGITHLFPTPAVLADADLDGLGLPGKRIDTLKILASKVAAGEFSLEGMLDVDAVKSNLLKIPGIGQWTTEYIAMRALREPDAFPASDLALKREVGHIGGNPELWRPWRAYAAIYLWKMYGLRMSVK